MSFTTSTAYVETTIAREGITYVSDDDDMGVTNENSCPFDIKFPHRLALHAGFFAQQELGILTWAAAADPVMSKVLRDCREEERYDRAATSQRNLELAAMEKCVELDENFAVLSAADSKGLQQLVAELVEVFPPAHWLYVSVGSSPR